MRRAAVIGLLFVLWGAAGRAEENRGEKPEGGRAQLRGRVVWARDDQPARGAIVHLIHLDSGTAYQTSPASRDGRYSHGRLPHGYYQLAVEAEGELHAVARPVNLEPGRSRTLDVRILSVVADSLDGVHGREGLLLPVLNRRAAGAADIPRLESTPFLKSPIGIGVIVGSSLVFLLTVL